MNLLLNSDFVKKYGDDIGVKKGVPLNSKIFGLSLNYFSEQNNKGDININANTDNDNNNDTNKNTSYLASDKNTPTSNINKSVLEPKKPVLFKASPNDLDNALNKKTIDSHNENSIKSSQIKQNNFYETNQNNNYQLLSNVTNSARIMNIKPKMQGK